MPDSRSLEVYALVSPTGRLAFREGEPGRMLKDTTVGNSSPHEFTIVSPSVGGPGLHGAITSPSPAAAPPNPLAATMIRALGGREDGPVFGILGLCGSRLETTGIASLSGLTDVQQRLIKAVYAAARARDAGNP